MCLFLQVYRPQKYYTDPSKYKFEEEKNNFDLVDGSMLVVEKNVLARNSVALFRTDLIPPDEIPSLYKMASVLEMYGKVVTRGKRIRGTKMVMFGMYYNATCGW